MAKVKLINKYQWGNRSAATTADSLFLYNKAPGIDQFYSKNPKYKKQSTENLKTYFKNRGNTYEGLFDAGEHSGNLKYFTSQKNVDVLNKRFKTKTTPDELLKKFKNELGSSFKTFPNLYNAQYDPFSNPNVPPIYLHPKIKPQYVNTYLGTPDIGEDVAEVPMYDPIAVKPVKMLTPKERKLREERYGSITPQPVPTKPAPVKIDKIEPKQASFSFTPPEDNRKPQMAPALNLVNPEGSPASARRFPAQNQGFFQKIKSKITGKNPMPYWMDKQGVKRYPHLGENNPEQVKQIQMLKGNLDPKVKEDRAELKRIDKLLADPSRRQQLMSSYQNGVRETKTIKNRKDFKPGLLNLIPGLSSLASGNQLGYNRHEQYGQLGDLYRYYGGMPLKHNVLEESMNKPTKSKDKNAKYISLNKDPEFINEVLENYKRVSSGKLSPKLEKQLDPNNWSVSGYSSGKEQLHRTKKQGSKHHSNAIGRYILGRDKDEKGDYISYYDKFDQGTGSGMNLGEMLGVTKPFEIYDRIYLENNDVKHNPGKWLPEVTVTSPSKKQNGVREANSYTFGKEPGVGRAVGKVLTGFADDKGKGYSISPSEVMKNLAMPASLLSSCTAAKSSGKARCRPPKNPGYINSIRR